MTKLEIEVTGLAEMIEGFKHLPEDVMKEVEAAHKEDLRDVASILANYPPEQPGQWYVRTGNLGLGWLTGQPKITRISASNFNVTLKNPVRYSGKVQGSKDDNPSQTEEFKARGWTTTDQALEQTEDRAQKRLEKAVQKVLDRLGKK